MKEPSAFLTGALALYCCASGLSAAPISSEFMASNDTGLMDEDGETSDWIEIHNPDGSAVDLDGITARLFLKGKKVGEHQVGDAAKRASLKKKK
jgi:hypothetical protein